MGAENSIVWRWSGVAAMIVSTSGRKPRSSMSPATCRQSSRVGTRTRACTSGSSGSTSWTIGMPKARVLPVPVRAWPMRSTPARARGRQRVWMGKGCSIPTRASVVAGDLRVDLLAPGVDPAGQAADPGPAVGLHPHRGLGAARADVAVEHDIAVHGDLGRGPLDELVEADVQRRRDGGDGPLGDGPDVHQQGRVLAGQGRGQGGRVPLLQQRVALVHRSSSLSSVGAAMLPPGVRCAANPTAKEVAAVMASRPAEVFESLRQALAAADADAAVALYAPDGVYYEPDNVPHNGRDEIRTYLASVYAVRGPVELSVKRQVGADQTILAEWTSAFTDGGRRSVGVPGVSVVELGRDGIVYHRDF